VAKPKALYFEILGYTAANMELLRSSFDVVTLPDPGKCSDAALVATEVVFAPLGYRFDAAFMQRVPKLRVIATNTTSVPHVDVAAARARGIEVISLAGESEFLESITPTAELTLGLMITLTRNVAPAMAAVKSGVWRRWDHGGERMLSRMHLGIVGLGRLGRLVETYARAIGMRISTYDPGKASTHASLKELAAAVDIVSVHASLNDANVRMFDRNAFGDFRKGAYFINTARGELVDNAALLAALQSGHLAGAALDVLDGEFAPTFQAEMKDHPLVRYAREHANLILTPHIGGSTKDAWSLTQERTIRKALDAVRHART
jgi:phosphoglycerate dehydrogenase-like enzyme